jgi:Fe-S-cluster containining protein
MKKRQALPLITNCLTPEPCGVCCHGQEALPLGYWLGIESGQYADPDGRVLPADLLAELHALADEFTRTDTWPSHGEPCVWYDAQTKRCRHHQWRPDICVEFKIGGDHCRRRRREEGIDKQGRYSYVKGRLTRR